MLTDLRPERLPLVRVLHRCVDTLRHPTLPAATVYRPWSMALIAIVKPSPSSDPVVGTADLVARLRATRSRVPSGPDKLTIAALVATLDHYVRDEAPRNIPSGA